MNGKVRSDLRGVGVTVMKILEWNLGDWKDGSMVKSIGCSSRRPRFTHIKVYICLLLQF